MGKVIEVGTKDRLMHVRFRNQEYSINTLYENTFSFHGGKLYGILCNHGECGWGLSYLLSGRENVYEENIIVGGKQYKKGEIVEEGWYIGEGIKNRSFMEKTLIEQIKYSLKKSKSKLCSDDIIKKFDLSTDIINYKFSHLGWKSWRASVAIGYAYEKEVFCFPWLDTAYLKDIIYNTGFFFFLDILRKKNKVIILPSSDRILLESISDNVIEVNDPRFHEYKYIQDFIKQQKNNI